MSENSVRRTVLWGVLVGVLLAAAFAMVFSRQWVTPRASQDLPVIAQLPDFELVDQTGKSRSSEALKGLPFVADFIFTRCGGACPRLTYQMVQFGKTVDRLGVVRRVSISVDPNYDRPEILQAYAAGFNISDPNWLFLTGERDEIYELVMKGFKLGVDDDPPEDLKRPNEPIVHSTRFVLVDQQLRIRGYYDAFQSADLERLANDIESLL